VEIPAMDKGVAALNIEHYRKLLSTETEPSKRATLERLLAEEKAKLAALTNAGVGPNNRVQKQIKEQTARAAPN
jgi:hypothetical protein